MKLLISWMQALSRYVSREFYYTMKDLTGSYGWKQVEPPVLSSRDGSVGARLRDVLGEIPDVVLFWETYDLFNAVVAELLELDCRTALFVDDLHMLWGQESSRDAKLRALSQCDVVLASYAYAFNDFYPELRDRNNVVWIPHAASPDFELPFNKCPENAVLLSGAVGALYPLRLRMKALAKDGRYAIVQHAHPGYSETFDYKTDQRVGPAYAGTIQRFKAAFTDALTFGYVVAKHFEIPATGALLVADRAVAEPLRQLGFMENVHYLSVSEETLEKKIQYVLAAQNAPEIEAMRHSGQQLVLCERRTCDRANLIDRACTERLQRGSEVFG